MSLVDIIQIKNECSIFSIDSCTKLTADRRVWWIKRWWINENSPHCILFMIIFQVCSVGTS